MNTKITENFILDMGFEYVLSGRDSEFAIFRTFKKSFKGEYNYTGVLILRFDVDEKLKSIDFSFHTQFASSCYLLKKTTLSKVKNIIKVLWYPKI